MWNGGIVNIIHPRPHPVTLRNQKLLEGFEQGMSMISLTFLKKSFEGRNCSAGKGLVMQAQGPIWIPTPV